MKKILPLFALMLFACTSPTLGSGENLVTDEDTGRQVILNNVGDKTRITDVESGDFIDVDGNIADTMNDAQYTGLMRDKRASGDGQQSETPPSVGTDTYPLQSGPQPYSISSFYETPKYYKSGTTAVRTTVTALSYFPNGDAVRVELRRVVPYWFDTSYGTYAFQAGKYYATSQNLTWGGATASAAYYYLRITKTYNGYWTVGTFSLAD